jgi:hypothetical protein
VGRWEAWENGDSSCLAASRPNLDYFVHHARSMWLQCRLGRCWPIDGFSPPTTFAQSSPSFNIRGSRNGRGYAASPRAALRVAEPLYWASARGVEAALTEGRIGVLTGPFGAGKTALAVMAAESLRHKVPGGIALQAAGHRARLTDLVAAAFPTAPTQSALLIIDEYDQMGRERGESIQRLLEDHAWLSVLLVGVMGLRIRGGREIALGWLSRTEAFEFARRLTSKRGLQLAESDLHSLIDATRGVPRLLARAIGSGHRGKADRIRGYSAAGRVLPTWSHWS